MINELKSGKKVVGIKQLRKALKNGTAKTVLLARDADPRLVGPIEELCSTLGVQCQWVETMSELGDACGIDVGASAAAVLN